MPGPPTGKSSRASGVVVMRWQGSKVVEVWHVHDWLGALQQLGVIPPMG